MAGNTWIAGDAYPVDSPGIAPFRVRAIPWPQCLFVTLVCLQTFHYDKNELTFQSVLLLQVQLY